MAITNTQASAINKMNVASQRAGLGTAFQSLQNTVGVIDKVGTYTVTAADVTATAATLTSTSAINGFIIQIFRSNNQVPGCKATVGGTGSTTLSIATNGSTYVLTANDVINYILF